MGTSDAIVEVTDANFEEEIEKSEGLHMIDFWAACVVRVGRSHQSLRNWQVNIKLRGFGLVNLMSILTKKQLCALQFGAYRNFYFSRTVSSSIRSPDSCNVKLLRRRFSSTCSAV